MHESMKGGGGKTGGGEGGGGGRERKGKKETSVPKCLVRDVFNFVFRENAAFIIDPKKFKIRDRIFLKSFTFLHKFTAVAASC